MSQFDDVLRAAQMNENITKALRLVPNIPETFRIYQGFEEKMGWMKMMADVEKANGMAIMLAETERKFKPLFMQVNTFEEKMGWMNLMADVEKAHGMANMFAKSEKKTKPFLIQSHNDFAAFDAWKNSINVVSALNTGNPLFEAMEKMRKQHDLMFGRLNAITDALKPQIIAGAQLGKMHSAMTGISAQILSAAVRKKDWGLIYDFGEVSEQVFDFSNRAYAREEAVETHEEKLRVLLGLITTFVREHKLGRKGKLFIDIVIFLMAIHQYYYVLKPKPETATKVQTVRIEQKVDRMDGKLDSLADCLSLVRAQLDQPQDCRTIKRSCQVKYKPRERSHTLTRLPPGLHITILQVHQEWVCIKYLNPGDGLLEFGWIMKKYIDKRPAYDAEATSAL